MLEIVFWASLSLILWSYCGYPAYLWIKSLILVGKDMPSQDRFPFISIMIAAYNEEKCIIEKVQNCFEFDYPKDRLEIIVASDGSTDNTLGALQRFSARDNIHILDLPRGGKAKSINAMFGLARGEIAILTDANVMLANNALAKVVAMFNDPEVGCVTTMKRLRGMASHGEGIYWRYEYLVKMLESRTSSSAGADGGFYAIRRDLYRPLHEANNLADDLALSISVWLYSKKILVAESIFSYEESATSIADEYKRKTRIAEGSCRVLLLNGWLLSPWHNRYFLEFFSHKVLRWAGPYLILIPFVCSALLSGIIIYRIFFILSVVFILAGLMGITALTSVPLFAVIGQFALANVAQVHGLYNLIFNPKPAYWKPRSG